METKVSSIGQAVTDLVEPILDDLGFELVDIDYLSKHGKWVLRLFVDQDGGVTIDDCVRISREVGDLIDVKDIIDHEYVLEVSSPGLNRPLKKEKDFVWAIGKKIKVKTLVPKDGRRNFTGYLKNFKGKTLYLETESGLTDLLWSELEKANLVYDFEK